MKKKIITTRKGKDGYWHFYYKGMDITGLWMLFFSELSSEEESNSADLFLKRYSKKLDRYYKAKLPIVFEI